MEKLKVERIIISKQFEDSENLQKFFKILEEKKMKVNIVEANQRINIEKNLYVDVLWPDSNNVITENILNNNSLVCKLVYKSFSIMFTGDIEETAEKEIIKEYQNNLDVLKSTALKVSHHGSKTSSMVEFLDAVKPKIALIGVGKNNSFGHPNTEIIERLEDLRYKYL